MFCVPSGKKWRCYVLSQNKAGCKFCSNCINSTWKPLLSTYQGCCYLGILSFVNKGVPLGHSFLLHQTAALPSHLPHKLLDEILESTTQKVRIKWMKAIPHCFIIASTLLSPQKSKQYLLHGNAHNLYYWAGSRSLFLERLICNCFKPN